MKQERTLTMRTLTDRNSRIDLKHIRLLVRKLILGSGPGAAVILATLLFSCSGTDDPGFNLNDYYILDFKNIEDTSV